MARRQAWLASLAGGFTTPVRDPRRGDLPRRGAEHHAPRPHLQPGSDPHRELAGLTRSRHLGRAARPAPQLLQPRVGRQADLVHELDARRLPGRTSCRPTTSASASPPGPSTTASTTTARSSSTARRRKINAASATRSRPRHRTGAPTASTRADRTSSCRPRTTSRPSTRSSRATTNYEPRDIYAHQARVNEFYLSYSKGPFFLRVGKQSISWGESDTIALLDQTNPFDLTLAAPGFFQDIDEARIPLYTRTYQLQPVRRPRPAVERLRRGLLGAGRHRRDDVDRAPASPPAPTRRAASTRSSWPAKPGGVFPPQFQFTFFDHLPQQDISSSRWGIRFQSVINRFLTLQTWVYRTYPQAPVPVKVGFPATPNVAAEDQRHQLLRGLARA